MTLGLFDIILTDASGVELLERGILSKTKSEMSGDAGEDLLLVPHALCEKAKPASESGGSGSPGRQTKDRDSTRQTRFDRDRGKHAPSEETVRSKGKCPIRDC